MQEWCSAGWITNLSDNNNVKKTCLLLSSFISFWSKRGGGWGGRETKEEEESVDRRSDHTSQTLAGAATIHLVSGHYWDPVKNMLSSNLKSGWWALPSHIFCGRSVPRCQNWGDQCWWGGVCQVQRVQVGLWCWRQFYPQLHLCWKQSVLAEVSSIFPGVFLCPHLACSNCPPAGQQPSMLR